MLIDILDQGCATFFIMGQIINLVIVDGPQKDLHF